MKIHLNFFLVRLILAYGSPDYTGTQTSSTRVYALMQNVAWEPGGVGRPAEMVAAWFMQMLSPT